MKKLKQEHHKKLMSVILAAEMITIAAVFIIVVVTLAMDGKSPTAFTISENTITGTASNAITGGVIGVGKEPKLVAKSYLKEKSSDKMRVLITPKSLADVGKIKGLADVRHNFRNKFSVDVPKNLLAQLRKYGYVEEVALYYVQPSIKGKPMCGDGIISGGEKCGEPGLECPVGYSCENCKCKEPSQRLCSPNSKKPWGVLRLNTGAGGSGVNVAVLDTGVNKDHPDLKVKSCRDATKRGIVNRCKDGHGHGTHVSGTVSANGGSDGQGIIGVAPQANLWMVKVCGDNGMCWADDIAAAIRYTTDQGANIISMSLGSDSDSGLIREAIAYAVSRDVLVIAAAGNDGPGLGTIDYPGANANTVAVAATQGNDEVAYFSSRGLNDGDYVIEEKEVEFAAPGVQIESTWNDGCYNTISGTSMAAPHIAGLAAINWQGSAASTRTYLHTLGIDIDAPGDDPASGFGIPVN